VSITSYARRVFVPAHTAHSVNAYFAFSVVGPDGTGSITYREALAAVFLEGWIFLFLSIFGVRQWLARNIPKSLALATGTGIGLFIAFIGLQPAGGLGVLGGDGSNLVGLGGCPDQYADPNNPFFCTSHVLQKPTVWLGIFVGGFFTALMMMYRVRGAIIIGILLVSIISWPRPTSVTLFPYNAIGDGNFDFFRKVVTFRPVHYIGNSLDYNYGKGKIWLALITFLYVDIMGKCDCGGIWYVTDLLRSQILLVPCTPWPVSLVSWMRPRVISTTRRLRTASMHSAFQWALSLEHLLSLHTSNHRPVLPMVRRPASQAWSQELRSLFPSFSHRSSQVYPRGLLVRSMPLEET